MALSPLMTAAACANMRPGFAVASLGYPDIIAPADMMRSLTAGIELEYREDSEAICKRHGLESRLIPDAHSLFKALGGTLDVYDIVAERGCEIPIDLNFPYEIPRQYDIVLDVGTMEHCFNVAQAAFTMATMVKLGGLIIHENPFNWGNHGFYGFNPTWYYDFYEQNGFAVLECYMVDRENHFGPPPPKKRFKPIDGELNVFAVARKTENKDLSFPTQSKYKKMILGDFHGE